MPASDFDSNHSLQNRLISFKNAINHPKFQVCYPAASAPLNSRPEVGREDAGNSGEIFLSIREVSKLEAG